MLILNSLLQEDFERMGLLSGRLLGVRTGSVLGPVGISEGGQSSPEHSGCGKQAVEFGLAVLHLALFLFLLVSFA